MPYPTMDYVPLPFARPRYTPDTTRLASIYASTGEQLNNLALQRGRQTAATFDRLASILSGAYDVARAKKAAAAAAALHKEEQENARKFEAEQKRLEREERKAERDAEAKTRKEEQDRGAARWMVDNAQPGPASSVMAELASRFPETAARFRTETALPARVTPGAAGEVDPSVGAYPVLEPSAEQVERERERTAAQAARQATAAAQVRDDQRSERQMAEAARHNRVMEGVAQQNANTSAEHPRTPAKMPAAMAEKVAASQTSLAALDRLESLYTKGGTNASYGDAFIGPVGGRLNQLDTSAPEVPIIGIRDAPEGFEEFAAETATLKNQIIQAITGAAVGVQEAARIMGQIPELTDNPKNWKAKAAATRRNLETLIANQIRVGTASEPLPNGAVVNVNPGASFRVGGFTVREKP